MKRIWRENKKFLTLVSFLFCFFCSVFVGKQLQITAAANSTSAAGFSFYAMSQAAAQFLNNCMDPIHGGFLPADANMELNNNKMFGNAGGLLGYQDEWEAEASFTVSGTGSGNTVEYYYNTLRDNIVIGGAIGNGGTTDGSVFAGYGYYGYALQELGLDETAMSGAQTSARQILGIVMLALYSMATSVDLFFNLVFAMLRFANPYRLFLGGLSVIRTQILGSAGPGLNGLTIGDGTVNPAGMTQGSGLQGTMESGNALLEFINVITGFYNALYAFSKAFILPILLAFALFSWLVVKKGGGFIAVFKPFFMKVLFIVLGVPLMFAAYTAALDVVYDFTTPTSSVSGTIVMTTFFDFEKWVYNSRLSWKDVDTLELDVDVDGTVSLSSVTSARARTYLSKLNNINFKASGITYTEPSLFDNGDAAQNMHKYNTTMLDSTGTNKSLTAMASGGGTDEAFLSAVVNMLQRYTSGDIVTPAAYQSYITSTLLKNATNPNLQKRLLTEYVICQSWQNYHPDTAEEYKYKRGDGGVTAGLDNVYYPKDVVIDMARYRFKGAGGDASKELWGSGGMYCTNTSGPNAAGKVTFSHLGGTGLNGIWGRTRNDGLSAMAMYNYLNSSFDSSKITVYSAANTTSDQVKVGHYSVTTVGTGLMKWIYLLDAIVLLGCSTVLGYGYAGGLLIANFKSIFKMIPNVLSGMLGSLRGIASALALTAAIIVELFGTCLLYSIANDMVYLLYQVIENPLLVLLTTGLGGARQSALGSMLPVVFGVISIILIALLTSKLMQWRVAICQATTEACTSFINKFVGINISAPNLHDPNMTLQNMASMVAGAGMAAAGVMGMSGNDIREAAGNGLDALTGKNGESGLLTGGAGGVLGDSNTVNDELTQEQRDEQALGVKRGNGTGETPGKDGEKNDAWSKDKDKEGSGGADGKGKGGKAGDSEINGGTVNANIEGEATEEDGDSIGAGENGYNSDANAEQYVAMNEEEFEAMVAESAAENKAAVRQASMDTPEYQAKLDRQAEAASMSSITDTNGAKTDNLQVVNSETGEAYTQADKDAGASFSVVDGSTGEVYTDSNGTVYAEMDASQLTMDSNGNVSAISDGNGNTNMVSQNDNPQKMIVDSNGVATGNLQVVNAETGAAYTQVDKDSGAAYTVLDSNGQVYVDSNGQAYQNMSASDVHMDAMTGQVDAIRDGSGHESVVMNNDAQAGSIITSADGSSTAGVHVINSSGGEYTEANRAAGDTFSVVTKDGTPYVSSDGQTFVNAPAADVSIDAGTGQVNAVRDASGNISEIQSISNASANFAATNSQNTTVSGGSSQVSVSNSNTSNQQAMVNEVNTGFTDSASTSSGVVYAAVGANLMSSAVGGGGGNSVPSAVSAGANAITQAGDTITQNFYQEGDSSTVVNQGSHGGGSSRNDGGSTYVNHGGQTTVTENVQVSTQQTENVSANQQNYQTSVGGGTNVTSTQYNDSSNTGASHGGGGHRGGDTYYNTAENVHVTETNNVSSGDAGRNGGGYQDAGFTHRTGHQEMGKGGFGPRSDGGGSSMSTMHTKEVHFESKQDSVHTHDHTEHTSGAGSGSNNSGSSNNGGQTGGKNVSPVSPPSGRSIGSMTTGRNLSPNKPGYSGRGGRGPTPRSR